MKKHIVYKIGAFPTVSETFVVQNITEAARRGFKVSIVTNTINSIAHSSQPDLLKQYKLLENTHRFSEPKASVFRTLKGLIFLCNPLIFRSFLSYSKLMGRKSLSWVFLLQFYLKFRKAECIHIHFATVLNPILRLKEMGFIKSKIMVSFHGFDAHRLKKGPELTELIASYLKQVEFVTVNSSYLKQVLVNKGFPEAYISIIPIGVDTSKFLPRNRESYNKDEPFKLISIGRLIKLKGHDLGIRVIKQLIDEGCNVRYTIIGEGEEYKNLTTLIKDLNLEEYIKLVGKKSQSEIKESLRTHQLFLMTSTFDGVRREAYGVVSLEAQAMGLPVIGFNSGGVGDTITDGYSGFVLEENDVAGMVEKVKVLIAHQEQYNLMSKDAIDLTRAHFDIEKTVGRYIEMYTN